MQKLTMLIESLDCIIGEKISKYETIKKLKALNKYYDEKLRTLFISKSFYCHREKILAGNKKCVEPCMYCVEKNINQ